MLTVRLFAHTGESVALHDSLETLALGRTHDIDLLAFGEDVYGDGFTGIFLDAVIAEFLYDFLGG